jgi:hypothetical protein
MRNTITFAVLVASATTARADPPPELGTPLPNQSAAGALSGISVGMGLDTTMVSALPAIDLGNGVTLPRRGLTFAGLDVVEYLASRRSGPGWFKFTGVRVDFDLKVAGSGADDFTANNQMFTKGDVLLGRFGLPSLGLGYRSRSWLASVELEPNLEWFSASYSGPVKADGSSLELAVAVDVQVCWQYNVGGYFPKNSAACLYAAPVVYRDGFLTGAAFGVRVFPI